MELWKWTSSLQQAMTGDDDDFDDHANDNFDDFDVSEEPPFLLMQKFDIIQSFIFIFISNPRPVPTDGKALMFDGGSWLRGYVF